MTQSHESLSRSETSRQLTMRWMKVQPVVTAFIAAAVRDRHHVEDLTQEVAATVIENYHKYDPTSPFGPWAMGIARNKVLHHLRTRGRDRHVFDDDIITKLALAHEKLSADSSERRDALDRCMKQLNDRSRRILDMRYMREMRVKNIAARLGMRDTAVSMTLNRIRAALARCIEERIATEGR